MYIGIDESYVFYGSTAGDFCEDAKLVYHTQTFDHVAGTIEMGFPCFIFSSGILVNHLCIRLNATVFLNEISVKEDILRQFVELVTLIVSHHLGKLAGIMKKIGRSL